MLLCSYTQPGQIETRIGVIEDEHIYDLFGPDTPLFDQTREALLAHAISAIQGNPVGTISEVKSAIPAAPVWAAGVTYRRSMEARMEESTQKDAYDRVYDAERPEIFLKAMPASIRTHEPLTIRSDSDWNVPEPELTLVINRHAEVIGYTIGNDVSSRAIEGENPLYLPQAKIWDGACIVGPAILLATDGVDPYSFAIQLSITRAGEEVFAGETSPSMLHRKLHDLVRWLFRGNRHPDGVYLMTGTGLVPPDEFSLQPGDDVRISIDAIGTLVNSVNVLDVETNEERTA